MKNLTRDDCKQLISDGKLKSGEVYSYKQLCEIFGEKVTDGTSKKSQVKKWKHYFVFEHPENKKTHKPSKKFQFFGYKGDAVGEYWEKAYKGRQTEMPEEVKWMILHELRRRQICENEDIHAFSLHELYESVFCKYKAYIRWEKKVKKKYKLSTAEYRFFDRVVNERMRYYINKGFEDLEKDGVLEYGDCVVENRSIIYTDEKMIVDFDCIQKEALEKLGMTLGEVKTKGFWKELAYERKNICGRNLSKMKYVKIIDKPYYISCKIDFIGEEHAKQEIVGKFIAERCKASIDRRLQKYKEDLVGYETGEYTKKFCMKADVFKQRNYYTLLENSDEQLRECFELGIIDLTEEIEKQFDNYCQKGIFNLREDTEQLKQIYYEIIEEKTYKRKVEQEAEQEQNDGELTDAEVKLFE